MWLGVVVRAAELPPAWGIAHRPRSQGMSCPGSRVHAARHGVRPRRPYAEARRARQPPPQRPRAFPPAKRQLLPSWVGSALPRDPICPAGPAQANSTGRKQLPTSSGTPTGIFPHTSSTNRRFRSHPRSGPHDTGTTGTRGTPSLPASFFSCRATPRELRPGTGVLIAALAAPRPGNGSLKKTDAGTGLTRSVRTPAGWDLARRGIPRPLIASPLTRGIPPCRTLGRPDRRPENVCTLCSYG